MKLIRFRHKEKIYDGVLKSDRVSSPSFGESLPLDEVTLLAPVMPSKIVAVGLNYKDHAKEFDLKVPASPVIFIKPATTIIGPGDTILYPSQSRRVDFEAELAVVIKDVTKNVSARDAEKHILGYTCINDVTARDLQKVDGQWTRSKSFDTFAPIGPWIETELDPSDLSVKSYLNGELKQSSRTSEFVFKIPQIIEFISSVMTLLPGDIIATGTPAGIGPMKVGDEVVVEIEGIGRLRNEVGAGPCACPII